MKKSSFKSGVHPFEGKTYSEDKEITVIEPSQMMVFPVSQHIGAPATPLVKVGDRVLKGMKIADASSFISSPVYSSVSGTVKKLEKRTMINGNEAMCIVVENDFEDECAPGFGDVKNPDDFSNEEIVNIVKECGIVGLGGAGFPTGVKISPKNADDIDYIIINGSECEPYLTSDYRIMLEKADEIIKGISIVLRLFKNAKAIIGVEDNKPKAIKVLEEKCQGNEKISVMSLKTRYPQGGERRLIASVTGREINSKMLPADAGVVVLNTATTYAIYDAVCNSHPLIHRVMTITGEGVNSPCNVDVPLGVSHEYVVEKCGGLKENVVKLISGGPMMGMAMPSLDFPVVKTSSSVLAMTKDDVENMQTTACIRCGKCVDACPENLVPQLMAQSVMAKNFDRFVELNGMECIECGCCTYVCPAKRPLTQNFKIAKVAVRNSTKK